MRANAICTHSTPRATHSVQPSRCYTIQAEPIMSQHWHVTPLISLTRGKLRVFASRCELACDRAARDSIALPPKLDARYSDRTYSPSTHHSHQVPPYPLSRAHTCWPCRHHRLQMESGMLTRSGVLAMISYVSLLCRSDLKIDTVALVRKRDGSLDVR